MSDPGASRPAGRPVRSPVHASMVEGRWLGLFADLEAQLGAADRAEFAAEVETRARGEASRLRLVDRLRPAVNAELRIGVLGAEEVRGVVRRVGAEWILLEEAGRGEAGRREAARGEAARGEAIVATAAVLTVGGVGRWSAVPESEGVVESRLGLAHALRGVARDRDAVRLWLIGGQRLEGTIDRVGRDFFEIATHERGEFRRSAQVRDVQLIAFSALAIVRRDAPGLL